MQVEMTLLCSASRDGWPHALSLRDSRDRVALIVLPTSCTSGLGASAPASSVFSSRVFPENFFSQSSSDQTVMAKERVRAQEPNRRAIYEHTGGRMGQDAAQRWQQDHTRDTGAPGWQQPAPGDTACREIWDKVISSSSQSCHTSLGELTARALQLPSRRAIAWHGLGPVDFYRRGQMCG